jgi:hypothetical protein
LNHQITANIATARQTPESMLNAKIPPYPMLRK